MTKKSTIWERMRAVVLAVFAVTATLAGSFFVTKWANDESDTPGGGESSELPDGPLQVLGVEVLRPVADAGHVPLNTAVQREWLLRNTGAAPITLGRTTIEVLEGC